MNAYPHFWNTHDWHWLGSGKKLKVGLTSPPVPNNPTHPHTFALHPPPHPNSPAPPTVPNKVWTSPYVICFRLWESCPLPHCYNSVKIFMFTAAGLNPDSPGYSRKSGILENFKALQTSKRSQGNQYHLIQEDTRRLLPEKWEKCQLSLALLDTITTEKTEVKSWQKWISVSQKLEAFWGYFRGKRLGSFFLNLCEKLSCKFQLNI